MFVLKSTYERALRQRNAYADECDDLHKRLAEMRNREHTLNYNLANLRHETAKREDLFDEQRALIEELDVEVGRRRGNIFRGETINRITFLVDKLLGRTKECVCTNEAESATKDAAA